MCEEASDPSTASSANMVTCYSASSLSQWAASSASSIPAYRSMLLFPRSMAEIRCKGLALKPDNESDPRIYYCCLSSLGSPPCPVSSVFGARCSCGGMMKVLIQALGLLECEESNKGFVMEGMDDLLVRLASIGASFVLINEVGIRDDNVLERKTVILGREEAFFQEHSNYLKNELYITGESYARHYIPAATERIHRGNKEKHGLHLNLKGIIDGLAL